MMKILITSAIIFLSGQLFAQEIQVKGRIVDSEHKPVPGVNILIMGTSTGTVANTEGYFEIKLSPGTNQLLFAYLGYKELKRKLRIEKGFTYTLEVMMMEKGFNAMGLKSSLKKFEGVPMVSETR
jgi:hypothetical protein